MSTPDFQQSIADAVTADQGGAANDTVDQGPVTDTVDTSTQPDTTTQPVQQAEPAAQPQTTRPYDDFVNKFPESFRSLAEEAAKEWDAGVTKRFQDLHSTYDPYKELVDTYEPEALSQGAQLLQALEADPRAVWEQLAQVYGFAGEQGAGNTPQPGQDAQATPPEAVSTPPTADELDPSDPLAQRLLRTEQALAAMVAAQQQQQTLAQQDRLLEETMTLLKQEKGEFDEDLVYRLMATGLEPDEAVDKVQALAGPKPPPSAPRVLSAGNGLPSTQVDPASLSPAQARAAVTNFLLAAKET